MKSRKTCLIAVLGLLALNAVSLAADWPQFLGPNRDGISPETGLNLDWKARPPRVVWKVALGDGGFSSVAVVGERLWTMSTRGERDWVLCLDVRTGRQLWAYDAAPRYLDLEKQGCGPRATPTYQQGRLYCLFPKGELLCLNAADGKLIWQVNVFQASGATTPHNNNFCRWGLSQSPLIEGDLVITQPGGDQNNSVVAWDKDSGKLVWGAGNEPPGYASPIAITVAGRRQLVCPTAQSILGVDPLTGQVLWRYPFGNRHHATGASPLWTGDRLLVSSAYAIGTASLQILRNGDQWEVREQWKTIKLQNHFATSVMMDGHLYGCHGDLSSIQVRCLDLNTGEMKWTERQPFGRGRCTLLGVAGRLISLSEQGSLQLLHAQPDGLVVHAELPDLLNSIVWSAPALADGRLYLRDQRQMLCLDLRRE